MLKTRYFPILIALAMVLPGTLVFDITPHYNTEISSTNSHGILSIPSLTSGSILSGFNQIAVVNPDLNLSVMVTLGMNNLSLLNKTLNELQNPLSPAYHHYLSRKQFISEFSPSQDEYSSYVSFFRSQGLKISRTYADRMSISISSSASQLERVFHTSIVYFNTGAGKFYAPNTSLSIDANYGRIAGVTGLSDQFKASISPMFQGGGSTQELYGADLQKAYQLDRLYQNAGYPVNETIATILWTGHNATGVAVAPYVPSDVSTYLNSNLPAGEPRSAVYGYPVGGALLPGPSAANDTTQANFESTLDLEMAGSTAPGANIIEVYGPKPTQSYLDQAFAAILNPSYNSTIDSALSHVSAISNSWGEGDIYDAGWSQYEQEAAALGITVLAASGDSGNTNSVAPSFPATFGNDSYGTLAVGGTQTTLSGTSSTDGSGTTGISSQSVWYGTPASNDGSQGGVSTLYNEPFWQLNSSDANTVITSNSTVTGVPSGRGTPDIAAVGANMVLYITIGGVSVYRTIWGTSIASPLDAGVIATMDSYLGTHEGFINPLIYRLGQEQYQNSYQGPPPFYFVYNGSNGAFSSASGYNLVDGWGSINAYNFVLAQQTRYSVTFNETGLPEGTLWTVRLSNGISINSTSTSVTVDLPNGTYNYTATADFSGISNISGTVTVDGAQGYVQLSFHVETYVVNFTETGLPVGTPWYVNITGHPSSGIITNSFYSVPLTNGSYQYSVETSEKVYSANGGTFLINGSSSTIDVVFSKVTYKATFSENGLPSGTTWYVNLTVGMDFSSTASNITISLPNGTYYYSISTVNKIYKASGGTFSLNGSTKAIAVTFSLLKYQVTFTESGLPSGASWQITLNGNTVTSSNSTITFSETNGTYAYKTGTTEKNYNSVGGTVIIDGSNENVPVNFLLAHYSGSFIETGLPSGSTWYVNVSGESSSGPIVSDSYGASFSNGTYTYSIGSVDKTYRAPGGSFSVNGSPVSISVKFSMVTYTVNFSESGLPAGNWYVNLTGVSESSHYGSPVILKLPNGTYSYTVQTDFKNYAPDQGSGAFTVNGANVTVTSVAFSPVLHKITFNSSGLPEGSQWSIVFNGHMYSSNSTDYSRIILHVINGSYSYNADNTSQYYSSKWSAQTISVNGQDENVTVNYTEFSFISGTISPTGSILHVNGVEYQPEANGSYKIELTAGNYALEVSDPGYISKYVNVTLAAGTSKVIDFNLTKAQTIQPGVPGSPLSGGNIYKFYTIAGVAGIIAIGVLAAILRRRH